MVSSDEDDSIFIEVIPDGGYKDDIGGLTVNCCGKEGFEFSKASISISSAIIGGGGM